MKKVIGYKAPRLLQELEEELKSDFRLPWQRGKSQESSASKQEGSGKTGMSGFFQNFLGGKKGQNTSTTGQDDSGPIHFQDYTASNTGRKKGGKRIK